MADAASAQLAPGALLPPHVLHYHLHRIKEARRTAAVPSGTCNPVPPVLALATALKTRPSPCPALRDVYLGMSPSQLKTIEMSTRSRLMEANVVVNDQVMAADGMNDVERAQAKDVECQCTVHLAAVGRVVGHSGMAAPGGGGGGW